MPIDKNQAPNTNNPNFVTKVVETPILDSAIRQQIKAQAPPPTGGGLRGFYRSNKYYFWAILAGVVIIGILAFFAFRKSPISTPKQANVAVSIDVPATVASGGEAVYKITVQNNDNQKLVSMQLELAYPDGETYDSSSPNAQNISGSLFAVPDLMPGQNAALFIKAKVAGNVGDQKTLDAKLHYSYSNFNSEFVQDQTATVTLAASDISITLTGPQSISNAQPVTYVVDYQNNSGSDTQNARVKMDYPDGFTFVSAAPAPDLGQDTWNISTLPKGQSGKIQIQGTFNSANQGETKTTTAEFLILGQNGNYFTQNNSTQSATVSSLALVVTQTLQSNNTSSSVVNPGDNLTYNISYQNNASTVATGVNIEVDLNTKAVDPASITAQGAQLNNYSIIWNASGVPQLASLLPNQSGQLSFSFKVNNPATKDSSTDLQIVSAIQIKANEYPTPFPGNQLTLKISSPASINTGLTYVSGSLPPKVGKTTTYQVSLSLTNSTNDFTNGVLTASIPSASFNQASVAAGELSNVQYDPSTSKLIWNFGTLPASTGRFTKPRTLTFDISLSPSSASANQSVLLVKDINLTATDLFTNQPVTASVQDMSTNDVQGQGYSNGQVQP